MQTRSVIAVLTGASLLLAGCLPLRRTVEARYGSLKDDPVAAPSAPKPRAAALPAPVDVPKPPAPAVAAPPAMPALPAVAAPPAPPPAARPRGTQDITADDRTREDQLSRCAQRHVDYQAGQLNETAEQKQIRDQICAELHRADHARKEGR